MAQNDIKIVKENAGGTYDEVLLGDQVLYIGTTSIALNRASATLNLAGIGTLDTTNTITIDAVADAILNLDAGGNGNSTILFKNAGAEDGYISFQHVGTHVLSFTIGSNYLDITVADKVQTDLVIKSFVGFTPISNDGAYLGTATNSFSDLFLASGGIINWNNGNVTFTHSAGVITSNAPISVGTSNAVTCGTIELGAASDTTLSRSAAGVLAVEDVVIPSISSTNTLTNKRITPRVVTTTDDASAEIDTDITDQYQLTAVANATTFTATGTPVAGQKLIIRVKDAGAAKGLTWNAVFRAIGITLPTTTVISKTTYIGFIYNATDTKWDCVAVAQEA